jgi:hypothetical protein
MSETKIKQIKALEVKLTSLVNCILNKAASDTEFATQLEEVLLSDSLRVVLQENKKKAQKSTFNPIAFLRENSIDILKAELERKTDSELRLIVRAEGIKKGKELKSMERQQMIDEVIQNSERRLKQGSVFLS